MAEKKFRVDNLGDNEVTINLSRLNGKSYPMQAKGFAYLSEDELAYVRNTSSAFERGVLKVNGEVPEGLDIPESPNALTDVDVAELLKKPLAQIKIQLEKIDNADVVRKVLETAKEQDKSAKTVEAIQTRLEELL